MLQLSDKAYLIALSSAALMLSALVLRNGDLMSLAIPLLVYLGLGGVLAPRRFDLRVSRVVGCTSAIPGEVISVRLTITNLGDRLVHLILTDLVPLGMEVVAGRVRHRLILEHGCATELTYSCRGPRGVYRWDAMQATASDPLGVLGVAIEASAPGAVLVQPWANGIRRVTLKPRSTVHTAGPIPVRLGGSGTDFLGVREYRLGDSLRRLNWRLSGRHPGRMFSNEYEREEIGNFGIILDARRLTEAEAAENALFECCVEAAASLSETLLRDGNRVALLIYGAPMKALWPGYGKRQLRRIIAGMSGARCSSSVSLGFLEYMPTRLFPAQSQLIVLGCVSPRDLPTYARLRSFGYDLLIISPDPVEYAATTLPATTLNGFAIRAARLERAVMLRRLLKLGVSVLDWNVSRPLAPLLVSFDTRSAPGRQRRLLFQ